MALVVLLRGVNVGGRRTCRPAALVRELRHLDAVNIGAAGTFVIRRPIARAALRQEIARRLPFDAEIMICEGRDVLKLVSEYGGAGRAAPPGVVRFVSVLAGTPRDAPEVPIFLPPAGEWLLQIVAREGRFVVGMYRRHVKAIGYLGALDRLFGVPATTRNWNTMMAIAKALDRGLVMQRQETTSGV